MVALVGIRQDWWLRAFTNSMVLILRKLLALSLSHPLGGSSFPCCSIQLAIKAIGCKEYLSSWLSKRGGLYGSALWLC